MSTLITNFFTVDVEDYFHVEAFANFIKPAMWDNFPQRVEKNTSRILNLLDVNGVKGTFFVLGWVAERNPGLTKRITAQGHEVASHGYSHKPIWRMSPVVFREDIRKSKQILEDIIGVRVFGYRAPTFSITESTSWALDIIGEEGFRYDSSIYPIHHDRYGYPTFSRKLTKLKEDLIEVPMSTIRVCRNNFPVGGGGYLRLFPLAYNRAGLRYLNFKEGIPAVLYIHPWELDVGQPRLKTGFFSMIRHYHNIDKMEKKLSSLLLEFRFGRICDHSCIL